MINTYNRQPLSFGSNKDYDKHFMYGSFNGVNDNKNVLSVDQESFADANNIYVSDDNLLVSRPPIKSIGITNVLKVFTFNNKILVLKDDFTLLAYNQLNEEPIATLQYDIPENEYKINCLQVEDKIYVFTDLTISNNPAFYALFVNDNKFKDAIDYIYTPITTLVTNNIDDKYESPNFLTSSEKTRFIYSTLSFVDFARLLNQKVEVIVDGKTYTINEWQEDNEKLLVNEYSYLNKNEQIVDIKEVGDISILLKYNSNTKGISVSFNGNIFYNLPDVNNLISMPQISDDGLCVFAFTEDNLLCCQIAAAVDNVYKAQSTFVWENIKYLERDNLDVKFNKSHINVAFGNFKTKDIYSYIITPDNNVSLSTGFNSCILYAQWYQGTKELFITEILNIAINNLNIHKMKLFVNNLDITLPSSQISPTIIGIVVDNDTAKALNFNEDVTGLGVLFIQEKTSMSNDIYNNDIVYINEADFSIGQSVDSITGYLSNPTKVTNSKLFGFKLQRWTVSGTSAIKDNSNTVISNNDYVSLEPIVTKINPKVITNTSKEVGYLDTENAKLVIEYLSGSGAKITNLHLKNDTTKIGNISLPEEFTITNTFTYDNYGSIFYNSMEMGYYNTSMNQITLYYLPVTFGFKVSGTNIINEYNGETIGSINTSNKTITVNIKYIYNNSDVYISQAFRSDDSIIGSITSNTINISPNYLKMTYTYSGSTIKNSSNISVGSFNTTKQITINDRLYTYNLSNNTVYSGLDSVGSIVKNGDIYNISIKYGINLSAGLSAGILYDLVDATVVGNINGIKGTLTFDNISYRLSSGTLGRYATVPLTTDGSVYRYLPPFRNILGFAQALHRVNISTTSLTNKTQINLIDQSGNNENISGVIYKNLSSANINYKKAIQVNYYPDGEKQPAYEQLKNYITTYYNETYIPDFDITFSDKELKIEDNYEIINYNIKICSSVKYTDGTDQDRYVTGYLDKTYVANVLNTGIISWKSNNTTSLQDYISNFKTIYAEKILNVNNSKFSNKYIINNDIVLTDKYLYTNKVISFIIGRNVKPLFNGNYIYYTYNNILYTNKLPENKQITLDIKTNGNYTQKVFDKKAILNEYFLSFGNLVEISSTRRNKDNEFLLYLPNATEQKYVGSVNELHLLSSSEVGVFLNSEIWTLKSLGSNNDKTYELWSNIKTKLNLGIKAGSEVITSIDGSSVIFATPRGIANMHYQENVQSADQILGYLSDVIQYTYDYYRDKAIKFVVYKYLILCYLENDNKILLFDIKRNAWWKWSYKANITRIFAYNDIVYILSNNSLYKFDTQYDDYTDDGDKIDWSLTTQKLHLGTINYTKFIKRLNIMALGDSEQTCNLRTNMYRNVNHTVKEDTLDVDVKDLRTLVKIFSFMMVNQFQFTLSAYLEDTNNYQLKINTIDLTYQLKGGV